MRVARLDWAYQVLLCNVSDSLRSFVTIKKCWSKSMVALAPPPRRNVERNGLHARELRMQFRKWVCIFECVHVNSLSNFPKGSVPSPGSGLSVGS